MSNTEEAIVIVIEGQIFDEPAAAAVAFNGIVDRLMQELPDQYKTRENTAKAVAEMIGKENLYDHGIEPGDFNRFWEAVEAVPENEE